MAWEYADLFDARDFGLLDWKSEPTDIRVGSMGYRTRTTVSGPRLEAEIFPLFGREKNGLLRKAKRNQTREAQKKANIRRAKEHLVRMIDANFTAEDIHLTLTYREEETDWQRARKDVRNFLRRVKRERERQKLPELKFIYAIGHDADERIHAHVILNGGIGRDALEKIWGKGITNAMRLQPDEKGLQGIANYIYRQNEGAKRRGERAGLKMWAGSRNLKKPKSRTSDSKCSNARVRRIAADFEHVAKAEMEKLYPGYAFVECRVSYSDIVNGVYIRALMRRIT